MPKAAEYTLLVSDRNLTLQGDPILCWTTLDVVLRFNEPSSGMFTCPAHDWIRTQLAPGNRILVVRNQEIAGGRAGEVLVAGPIESWLYEKGDDGDKGGVGTLTVNFSDDLALFCARTVYPNGAIAATAQTLDRWQFTGNAEVALRTLFDRNIGLNALPVRRMVKGGLGTLAAVGTTVTIDADRFMPMGDLLREIARVGGGLGFRTRQPNMGGWVFDVYQPVDRSTTVRFGFGLGNLQYLAYEVKAPTATSALVGGQGEGADRAVIERNNATDETAWGRYETLVSRAGTTAAAQLNDDGDKALADGAPTTRIPSSVRDTDDMQFGVHYGLGDKVAVETWPQTSFVDIVHTVHIQAWPTAGHYVSATIGNQSARTAPIWEQRLQEIEQRLSKVERNVKPAVKPAS